MPRSRGLDQLVAAGPPITGDRADKPTGPAVAGWRVCFAAGLVLLVGFGTPLRLGMSRLSVWAHDWLAQHGDPHHHAHKLVVATRQGGGDWKPGTRAIVLGFAVAMLLASAVVLGRRKAALGQNPLVAFVTPSLVAVVVTAVIVVAPPLAVALLAHWRPATAQQVMQAMAQVAESVGTFLGRNGW